MMLVRLLIAFLVAFFYDDAVTQGDPNGGDRHPSEAFERPTMPAPTIYRSASGAPGSEYWQQRADYRIEVSLDPESHRLTGNQTITYTNHSPDTLNHLWLQLDQNRFAPGSRGRAITPPGTRFRGGLTDGGKEITSAEVEINGQRHLADYLIDDTRMRITLPEPMAPRGSSIDIHLDWTFIHPGYGADRTGRIELADGWLYQVAQWYPRMYVYDDVNGWDPLPYLGAGEFYLSYGDFDVQITVPSEMVVAATGVLQNPDQVLTTTQIRRLEQARLSSESMDIISLQEAGTAESRPATNGTLTWHFQATNVRDFAWAASAGFIWDAGGWEDVLIMSFYPREGIGTGDEPGWEESTQYTIHAIDFYSEFLAPYPYPVAVNVAGPIFGMEYPMVSFAAVTARNQALFGVTDHEFGHMWFPMIVGNDERRNMWMDEGLNTFMNHYSNLAFYGPEARRAQRMDPNLIAIYMVQPNAQPVMTPADQIHPQALGFSQYLKPGYALHVLREYVLGPDRFDPAFKVYFERWAFRHPQPADFFRSIEDVSGEDLSWFWRGWFYSTDLLDQAIDSVTIQNNVSLIHLSNREGLVMPVELEITFEDKTTARHRVPVESWFHSHTATVSIMGEKRVAAVQVDPDFMLPDVNRENNAWRAQQDEAVGGG